jgi:phosphatidylglycerophosphate synthase
LTDTDQTGAEQKPAVAYMIGDCDVDLWGISPRERLRRSFSRVGVSTVLGDDMPLAETGRLLMVRADFVFDHAVVGPLVQTPGVIVTVSVDGRDVPVAAHVDASVAADAAACLRAGLIDMGPDGVDVIGVDQLGSAYDQALRKRESPYVMRLEAGALRPVEWRMFKGSYKGVTDFVTKWFWPVPAFWATKYVARLGVTPNTVTTVGLVLVVVAYFLFDQGYYVTGLVAAWIMTFLDTVDGKLARLTLTSSKFGNIYDHGIDLLHPPFWYLAWGFGLSLYDTPLDGGILSLVLWVIVAGYILGRAIEGVFMRVFSMHMHVWQRKDSVFRLFTARRNPNMVILTLALVAGRPDLGLVAVAVWTATSVLFHLVRLYMAAAVRRRGGEVVSWLA